MITALTQSVAAPQADPPQVAKLKKAASEFESMLLAKWWSSMKESTLGADDDSSDPGHDTLDQMGIQAMSSAVASRGGLGIASMLVHSLLSNTRANASNESGGTGPKPQK